MNFNFQQINAAASPEVQMNGNLLTINHTSVYGNRPPANDGLTWGYFGGRWGGFEVDDDVLSLTNNTDNYISVDKSDGSISVEVAVGSPPSPTNWEDTDNFARVYKVTTASSLVTDIEDHRAGPAGVHGGGAGGVGAGPTTFVAPRVASTASSGTPTPNADTTDVYILTALAVAATFGAPTGTPVQAQPLLIRIKDNGSAQTLAFNAIYRAIGATMPATTTIGKTMYIGAIYNSTDSKWDVVSVVEQA